ncbi:selenium cofactor biosynthesis protein YqeC [Acidaminobacter hydrogenoformans]|uniref:Probable selenium-dependent hydroxylase accessory protein YqeC n=1 Tax=Acidaminobacter hydrogenoformans DSM 2784 TaxID=1120920 RepID=A0A1G5RS04_9FIRM|nr:selenium cofactor biosynthesis protein YqeC [Acidaminobacter hydrogenoformans]SCZ76638.1 probable selenium-dependent hydroxylase accessory protein YqeC [Acidaminobacter hydrogenoformans DSM 2784]
MLLAEIERLLKIRRPTVISLCGAGGKTSALFDLAADYKVLDSNLKIAVLTTTRMMLEKPPRIDHFLSVETLEEVGTLKAGITMVARGMDAQGKIYGFEPDEVDLWISRSRNMVALIEADGANKRPLKAPRAGEPRFPGKTQVAIGVLGADAFDVPASGENVHRLPLFLELTGLSEGSAVTAEAIVKLISSKNGLFKDCPETALEVVLINKAERHHDSFIEAVRSDVRMPVIVTERGLWR